MTTSCYRGCCSSDSIPLSIVPKSSLTLLSQIATGAESAVYEARLHGNLLVAKKPRLSTSEDIDRYHKELQLLSKMEHPNIVKLVAAHAHPPDYLFLFQMYDQGNLSQALHVKEWVPSWRTIAKICLQLGPEAAVYAAHAIPNHVIARANMGCSPSEALSAAFIDTDTAFRDALDLQRPSKKTQAKNWHPGCTATAILLVNNLLLVANAGDCRTVLCRNGQALPLSKDHTASCLVERERVVRSGGQVVWQVDTWRVGPAALQVTRSIGDDDLKPAVTAEPEITETILTSNDEFLIIASDGLWDKLSNEEAVSCVKDTVKEPTMSSKRLATEAVERGSSDNITVIIVFLKPVSTLERVY